MTPTPTLRQRIDQIRRDLVDPNISEQHLRLRIMEDAEQALLTLDVNENDRYRDALKWISNSNPAATESQIICARRALGLPE